MTDLQPTDLHPQSLATAPETPADAVRLQARIDAVQRWLGSVRDDLRGRLERQAADVEGQTGGVFNLPVSNVGRALMTDPQPKPRVADPQVFAEWLAEHGHGPMTAEKVDVKVRWPEVVEAAHDAVPGELGIEQARALLTDLVEALPLKRSLVPAEDALDRLLTDPDSRVQVQWWSSAGGDEYVVAHVDENGEPHEVPGTKVSLASRRLQVRIERGHKDHLDHLVEDAVGPPVLRPGAEA